jgi:hypothetical protein
MLIPFELHILHFGGSLRLGIFRTSFWCALSFLIYIPFPSNIYSFLLIQPVAFYLTIVVHAELGVSTTIESASKCYVGEVQKEGMKGGREKGIKEGRKNGGRINWWNEKGMNRRREAGREEGRKNVGMQE